MTTQRRTKPLYDKRTPVLTPEPAVPSTEHNLTFEARLYAELVLWRNRAEIADARCKRITDRFTRYRARYVTRNLAKRLIRAGKVAR